MLAEAALPLPATTVCNFDPSAGSVIWSRQGSLPPATTRLYVPLAIVVAVPVPTWHLAVIVAPAIAFPVAAVPLTVKSAGVPDVDEEPPPPPHATSMQELSTTARRFILICSFLIFQSAANWHHAHTTRDLLQLGSWPKIIYHSGNIRYLKLNNHEPKEAAYLSPS
jgi:hypothetical protein